MTDKTSAGSSNPKGDSWEENAAYLLNRCAHTIRVREGGGPENLLSSLVVTFMAMERKLEQRSAPKTNAEPSLLNITRGQFDFTTAVTGNARLSGLTKAQFLHMVTLAWDARDAVKAAAVGIIGASEVGREAYLKAWDTLSETERDEWTNRGLGR